MWHLKKLSFIILLIIIFSLSASGLNVIFVTTDSQAEAGTAANISLLLTYDNGTPLNNTLVNFSTSMGTLSSSSGYTDSSGIVNFSVNSTSSGIATINASSGTSYNLTDVEFVPSSVSSVIVHSNLSENTAGNVTNLTFVPVDRFGNENYSKAINLTIGIRDILGTTYPDTELALPAGNFTALDINRTASVISDTSIPSGAYSLLLNSTIAGNVTINCTAGSATNSTSVRILPGSPGLMKVVYNDDYTVNTSSSLYVSVLDKYENPIENANVTFSVTSPANTIYNSPVTFDSAHVGISSALTDNTGRVSNNFTTDKKAGDNILTVSVTNTSLSSNVTITGLADKIHKFFLTYSPESVIADNQHSYVLSAKPTDQFRNPILPSGTPIKEQVKFTTGNNAVLVPLNSRGSANTIVGPTPYIESVSVTATYRNESGYTDFTNSTTMDFVAGPLSMLDMYAVPNAVLAQGLNGNHQSNVTLVALDQWGHSLSDVEVTLYNANSSVGEFTVNGSNDAFINTTTDLEGRIYGFFTGNNSGNTSIVASSGNVTGYVNISVKNEPFMSVYLSINPTSVKSGSIVNVTTVISAEGELPITRPAASAMLVLDRSGSMDPDYYAGTPLDVVLVIDRSGSMSGSKIADAKAAAKEFADNLVSNSEVGVVSFSDSSRVDLEMTLMNSYDNKTPVNNAIDSISAGGYTAMGEAMADANELLINGRSGTRKVMVVLTDGETNTGEDQDGSNAIDVANANGITIYTIGLGSSTDIDEALLRHIASETGGLYYNAPTSSELSEIYNSIAQELSDYDVSDIEYGVEGFTPYDYTFHDTLQPGNSYEESFLINETINDLKVELEWEDSSNDLHLQLISPSGEIYGLYNNNTGYYQGSDSSEYIWIQPLFYLYPDSDDNTVETGTWTVIVTGSGSSPEDFSVKTYIDKKSAMKLSSYAFVSSFDESRGDKAGLTLYSFEDIALSDSQQSYVLDNSSWVGYFTAGDSGYYTFNVSWNDSSPIDVYLYDGIDIASSSGGNKSCEVSAMLSADETYYIEVVKGSGLYEDTLFTVNVSTSEIDTVMTAYYDSSGGGGTPKLRTWNGMEWSSEDSANYVGGSPYHMVLESSPAGSEIIMATSDNNYDVNVQVWDGSEWGAVDQFSGNLDSYSTRGFDLKYEQLSGEAVIVYMDMNINDGVPEYRIWNGSSWSSANPVDSSNPGAGDINWVSLAVDPNSDEMILVTLDDQKDIRAQVWSGSSWGNAELITNNARTTSYQCFDVAYEQSSGRAIVSWSDSDTGEVMYKIWNGNSWSSSAMMYMPDARVYWIKMAADPTSNDILLAAQDNDHDIHLTAWDGSAWLAPTEIETNVYDYSRRSVDIAFEHSDGNGIIAWGDSSSTPRYCIWDGSSFSTPASASSLGGSGSTYWVQLTPDPVSDDIFLMSSDGNSDLNIQEWNGSSWGIVTEVETSSTRYYECFDIVFNDVDPEPERTAVSWNEWTASVASTLQNDSLSHLENAIDTISADGLTAIDEGLFAANNELASEDGNSTIVIMTDGLDNAGYHSLLKEAYKARDNNTVIYTVGFGNNESEVDPVLEEIAYITGGEYYFAPNSSVLKDIFRGIASQITNFSADGPVLEIHVPHNYITSLSVAKATYITGSSNSTTGNSTYFITPKAPPRGNAEPNITTTTNMSRLQWQLPNMGAGDKWGVWYQMQVDGAGYVPLIFPSSTVTYTDLSGENITVYVPSSGSASIGGGSASVLSYSLGKLDVVPDKTTLNIANPTRITLSLTDETGNSSFAYVHLYSSIGYFNNYENPINVTVVGSDSVNFTSITAGKAYITAYAYNVNNESDVLVSEKEIIVRPKGKISIS